MPGNLELGQVYSYPQRLWRKRRYQYLQYFMLPKHLRYEPETEFNTGLVGAAQETVGNNNEDSNGSNANSQEKVRTKMGLTSSLSICSLLTSTMRMRI